MKSIIISLSSVIDTHLYFESFELDRENFVKESRSYAAGKGVNVAKAMKVLKAPFKLITLLGEENRNIFDNFLCSENIQCISHYCKGKTRENFSIHCESTTETRICSDNFYASTEDCIEVLKKAFQVTNNGDIVIVSGRFPKNVCKDEIISCIQLFNTKDVFLIIDSASVDLADLTILKPYLIKPNEEEIKIYGCNEQESIDNLLKAGVCNIAFSKGKNGITLYNGIRNVSVTPPCIYPLSSVGAGDCAVAGFAYAILKNMSMNDSVTFAVSCGTASCLTEGGIAPRYEDIFDIFKNISSN